MSFVSITRRALVVVAACAVSATAQTAAAQGMAPNDHAAYAAVATPAAWAGIYRLQFTSRDHGLVFVRLLVEREGDAVSGTIVSDDFQSTIYDIRIVGDEMHATMPTDQGTGEIVLRNTPTGIAGTLTVHGKTWDVSGQRTT